MPVPELELHLLRAFVAVAEAGSMTAGAKVIGRTYRGIALKALESVGRASTIACTASSLIGVQAAVAGGLGVTVLGRSFVQEGLKVLDVSDHWSRGSGDVPSGDWPPLPMTEIVLLGDNRAQNHLANPLVSFLTESLAN